jgi:hypothetical protein
MNLRRKFLTRLGMIAVAVPSVSLAGNRKIPLAKYKTKVARDHTLKSGSKRLPPPTQARGGDYFPNTLVYSHTGEQFNLYDDLIRDKVVMINFMSIKGHKNFPATEHLTNIANKLGDQLGRDVFICSISTDPEHDTPKKLQAFADQNGANKAGWHFLTITKNSVSAISKRLRRHSHGSSGHPIRMVHYGNGGVGVWGAFGVDSEPGFVVERLSWVQNGKQVANTQLKRGGPGRVKDNTLLGHNRAV